MADNEIRVVISGVASALRSALDGAKGDLGGLKTAIKDVPNKIKIAVETDSAAAEGKLTGLKAAIRDIPKSLPIDVQVDTLLAFTRLAELRDRAKAVPNHLTIKADADTGVASAKLRLLEGEARRAEEAIARAELGGLLAGGGGGGGPGFGSRLLSGMGGGLPLGAPLAIGAAGAPLVAGAAGAATAVAGSAGAGILGAGALGVGGLGALGVGLGSMLPVLAAAKTGITNVKTAMDALEKAQANYGAGSKQAQQAQQNLNGVIKDAGPLAAGIATQLSHISDQWQSLSAPAQKALEQIIVPALRMVQSLLPTIAGIAKTSFEAIGRALDPVFKGLSSPAFKQVLRDLGDAFAKLAGPLIGAFSNIMRAFFSVAVEAAPYVIQIAQAFERWTASFARSLAPGAQLAGLIAYLVSQLHSWWNLATSIGDLMVTIFKSGAIQGQGLVDKLTAILDKWNKWLNTPAGQAAMTKFFADSGRLLGAVLSTLAPIVKLISSMAVGLIPTMTTLLAPIASILASISQWINGLSKSLPPVLNALPGLAVAVGVLAGWKVLQGLVSATAGSILSMAKGGGAGAAAGAGAGGAAARTAAGASSVEAAAGGAAAGGAGASVGLLPILAAGEIGRAHV